MKLLWVSDQNYMMIPLENNVEKSKVDFVVDGRIVASRFLQIANKRIIGWLPVSRKIFNTENEIVVVISGDDAIVQAIRFVNSPHPHEQWAVFPNYTGDSTVGNLVKTENGWQFSYFCELLGGENEKKDRVLYVSRDLIWWEQKSVRCSILCTGQDALTEPSLMVWKGDSLKTLEAEDAQGCFSIALLRINKSPVLNRDALAYPVRVRGKQIIPHENCKKYRIFKRNWERKDNITEFDQCLSFRLAPGIWPDICILPPEGKPDDISADIFEMEMVLNYGKMAKLDMVICGYHVVLAKDVIICGQYTACPVYDEEGFVLLRLFVCHDWIQIFCDKVVLLLKKTDYGIGDKTGVAPVTSNIAHFTLPQYSEKKIRITANGGAFSVRSLVVYGHRKASWSGMASKILKEFGEKSGDILFRGNSYTIFAKCVQDTHYGDPVSWAINDRLVLSPVRICEEYQWRKTGQGDMVRVINRSDVWKAHSGIERYPLLENGKNTIQAAYNIALDTFALCSDSRFSLPGQEGMWASGLFQGEGQGFGVWLRDSVHVAMRCGNLVDPETARKTLLYTIKSGFDNGNDGPALAVAGIWDYYLTTGDISILFESWHVLIEKSREMEILFDYDRKLIKAPMSTSNDVFPEPENLGYSLGSESYYMAAFEKLACMGKLLGHDNDDIDRWSWFGTTLREEIQKQYWNEEYGYFTSGPVGSEAHKKGCWESSGVESMIWSRFGVADDRQTRSVLKKLRDVALSDYGIILFPHRQRENHFTGSVWTVWQAGFADAAASCGDAELIYRLLYSQVRHSLINKTFYEVVDADTGIAWRWPGQLWHAAGFISIVYYGIFGIRYDERGMFFSPVVTSQVEGLILRGLRYRTAVLDIFLEGTGTAFELLVGGTVCPCVSPDITGSHKIVLKAIH
jgi:hypothetical protein